MAFGPHVDLRGLLESQESAGPVPAILTGTVPANMGQEQ